MMKRFDTPPKDFELRKLPGNKKRNRTRVSIGGSVCFLSIFFPLFLMGTVPLSISAPFGIAGLLLGVFLITRHAGDANKCPTCGSKFSAWVAEEGEPILMVCDRCTICWDTGDIYTTDATGGDG